jgi:hypothetical protein
MILVEQQPGYGNPDNIAPVIMNYHVWVRFMQIYLIQNYPRTEVVTN